MDKRRSAQGLIWILLLYCGLVRPPGRLKNWVLGRLKNSATANSARNTASWDGIEFGPLESSSATLTTARVPQSWVGLHMMHASASMVRGLFLNAEFLIRRTFGICSPIIRLTVNDELTPRQWPRSTWEQRLLHQYEFGLLYE